MKEEKLLYIDLLGTFSVSTQKKVISNTSPRAHTMWKFFKFLISKKGQFVPLEGIIDALWPEDAEGDSVKAIQNLVYRLRKLLPREESFILFSNNAYCWNTETSYYLDIDEFESITKQIKDIAGTADEQTLETLCRREMELYKGDFLEDLSDCEWAYPLTIYYRHIHSDCLRIYLDILLKRQEHDTIIDVCTNALTHDSFDEHFHACLINSLLSSGERQAAVTHYENIAATLKTEFDSEPSAELKEAGNNLKTGTFKPDEFDLDVMMKHVSSGSTFHGPYFCELTVFFHAFRVFLQFMERSKQPFNILVISLVTAPGAKREDINETMHNLKRSCNTTLRSSDVITQHSTTELLILLPDVEEKDIATVFKRIENNFFTLADKKTVHLKTSHEVITPELYKKYQQK